MATLSTVTVQSIVDSALQTGDVTDWIAPFFSTVAGANAARSAFSIFAAPGFTERQKVAIIRCASASSKWALPGVTGADANNVSVLQSVLASIAGSSQAAQSGGIYAGGNLVAALASAVS